jgi:ribosomal protein S18 acetylase RimI-like enzyme
MDALRLTHHAPDPKEYIDLRVEAGLSPKSLEGASVGLQNSIFIAALYDQKNLVGFGRIIGDGGTVYQIVDIAVKPAYQGNGLGKKIMKTLTSYLEEHAHPGSYVSLIADKPADELYKQYGFNYVTEHGSAGMYRWFKKEAL